MKDYKKKAFISIRGFSLRLSKYNIRGQKDFSFERDIYAEKKKEKYKENLSALLF